MPPRIYKELKMTGTRKYREKSKEMRLEETSYLTGVYRGLFFVGTCRRKAC